ncbi:DUF2849 domain-containing protein [Entomobacter blattae]|uniref:DUF2849 domain-containing protein n=1 Tax=Entomobacter blattae TaxID=2762277 RepID=A0A7H1NTV9_9PROT|nr:DUF2849 domain-containing protein [Entomobacter blattae]QNT79219.1 hypothetical protein JGUZn3_20140 [Entomobacter blattae]
MDARNNRREENGHSVITATRLHDGRIVWFTAENTWAENFRSAKIFTNSEVVFAIEAVKEDEKKHIVAYVYGVELQEGTSQPTPRTIRERIRAFGPTIHPEFATKAAESL